MFTIFNNSFSNGLFHEILALSNRCSKLNSDFNQTIACHQQCFKLLNHLTLRLPKFQFVSVFVGVLGNSSGIYLDHFCLAPSPEIALSVKPVPGRL